MLNLTPHPKPKPVKVIKAKKRKKKTSRQLLERQADTLVREIVLKRDGFCVCPAPKNGHSDVLQCGHLVTRGKKSVRFDLRNCNAQCSSDNMRHEYFPEVYTSWYIREYGEESYQELVRDSDDSRKLSVEQLQTLCKELSDIKARQEIDKDFKPRYSQEEILQGKWRKEDGRYKTRGSTVYEVRPRAGLGDTGADGNRNNHQED